MKLQITLDLLDLNEALAYLEEVHEYADIIEIGTPLSMKYGFDAIKSIREKYPKIKILDDVKIVDGGKKLTNAVLSAGADIVTVLAIADKNTLNEAITVARKLGKKVMIDTIGLKSLEQELKILDQLGADYISVHTGVDEQKEGITSIEKLKIAKRICQNTSVAVAGGIGLNADFDEYLSLAPDVLIIGKGIYGAQNRKETAKEIYKQIQKNDFLNTKTKNSFKSMVIGSNEIN